MKIVQLQASNVKRIRAVEITPQGNVVVIRGNNGEGKSSVLDSIAMALGGKGAQPPKPIRRGEERAEVLLDLDEYLVERRWTGDDRTYLEVRSKDGAKFPSPQALLDKLVGALSFDPLAFTKYEPARQLRLASELVGVDVGDLDAERKRVYEERTLVNREADSLAARVPAPVMGDVPDQETSVEELLAELDRAEATKRANDAKRGELDSTRAEHKRVTARIAELEAELKTVRERQAALVDQGKQLAGEVKALQDPDVSAIRARTKSVEATNARVRQKRSRQELLDAAQAKRKEAEALTAKLAAIAKAREERIGAAKFPVDGLGFGEGGLTLNGLPFEQASSAEQLRVSLAMGLALNPKLKVILIRDGSLLDEKSLALVGEMAAKADAQVWIEYCGKDGGPVGIVIEDGQVAGVPPPKKDPAPAPQAKSAPAAPATSPTAPSPADGDPCPF